MLIIEPIPHRIHLRPVTQQIPVIRVSLQIFEGHEQQARSHNHPLPDLLIRPPVTVPTLHERDEVRDVIGHLWRGGWGAVFVVEHAVVELAGHADDHVVEVRVEGFAFGHVHPVGRFEVVAGHDVVDVGDAAWTHADF